MLLFSQKHITGYTVHFDFQFKTKNYKYNLQKKIIYVPIEHSGILAQRGIHIINNVIATKVIILM